MQSEAIRTLTARYDLREDRVALDCQIHTGDVETLYFTQRLARAIVPALVAKVQKDPTRRLLNDFLQDEAVTNRAPAEAVATDPLAETIWLVTHLHLQDIENGVRVIFSHEDERAVHLECDQALLRNIIDILYKAFGLANWPRDIFPSWVSPTTPQSDASLSVN